MNQAKIIASNDSIITAVKHRDYRRLATIADKLQSDTDFDYVVIGDKNSIRLYHPNPEKIGYPMQFTKPGALENGESYFITGKGSIGMAMRAKTPIFDDNGNVIGVVSIGYLVSKIDSWRLDFYCRWREYSFCCWWCLCCFPGFRRPHSPPDARDGAKADCARCAPAGGIIQFSV